MPKPEGRVVAECPHCNGYIVEETKEWTETDSRFIGPIEHDPSAHRVIETKLVCDTCRTLFDSIPGI